MLADEPTTAFDVTVETQILDLLVKIRDETGVSIVFISHDLGAEARIADRVVVMYAGKSQKSEQPKKSITIPGIPTPGRAPSPLPAFGTASAGPLYLHSWRTAFASTHPVAMRLPNATPYALAIDYEEMPPMFQVSDTHYGGHLAAGSARA